MDARLTVSGVNVAELEFEERRKILTDITERFLCLLSKRTRYKENPALYEKGALGKNNPDVSFLEYSIMEKEKYLSKIGIFSQDTEFPLTSISKGPFRNFYSKQENFKHRIVIPDFTNFYVSIVKDFCESGENPGKASRIIDIDVDCIEELHSRVQFGRYIIDGKIKSNPELKALAERYDAEKKQDILKHIILREQEKRVIDSVVSYSNLNRLCLKEDKLVDLTVNLIKTNTFVQFEHLKKVYGIDLNEDKTGIFPV